MPSKPTPISARKAKKLTEQYFHVHYLEKLLADFLENLKWLGAEAKVVEVVGNEVILDVSIRRMSMLRGVYRQEGTT